MNVNQFKDKLEDIRSYALDDFAEQAALKLQQNIQDMWYDEYTPEDYSRTYELLNSVDVKITPAGRQIYINENSIGNGGRQGPGGWTEHVGVTGERVDSFADMISENAQGNPKGGNKRLASNGGADTDFFAATEDWVEENLSSEIKALVIKELGRNGIRAKATTGRVANIHGNMQQGIRIKI